jgi:hypothetical protein
MRKVLILSGATMVLLAACSVAKLNYEGKQRTYEQVEEQIEDQLEAENIGLDFEVDIDQETKTKKKKNR